MAHITNEKFIYDWSAHILLYINFSFQEFAMSTVLTTPATRGTLDNVGRALSNFADKLLAFAPFAFATSHGIASQASTLREREKLLRLAKNFDALSPNQAAELRNLAGRD